MKPTKDNLLKLLLLYLQEDNDDPLYPWMSVELASQLEDAVRDNDPCKAVAALGKFLNMEVDWNDLSNDKHIPVVCKMIRDIFYNT